ncbi:MAG: AAA family ATPase, partial [Planctomycetota bacterium]|nr:AAA family ATPase [Planctomycetota bacterium]
PSEMGRVCFLPAFDANSIAWSRAPVSQPKSLRHGVWMLIPRGQEIDGRVRDTVETVFRKNPELKPEWFKLQGWTDVTPLRINVDIKSNLKLKKSSDSAAQIILGGQTEFKGSEELAKTSINLSQMYPEQLQRSFLRSKETESLEQLLWARQKRATLVVGPAGVGKTALVHEMVFRHEQRRELEKKARGKREVYELNPRLVIAGMSYVGQWQQRMLAILKDVEKRDHVLFVSDLIDMFNVGQSSSSKTTLSSVLKPYIERGHIRFVGEASPEVFRILKEKDRGFADLFKVVRLDPVDDSTTLSILIRAQRPLERDHDVTIRADALSRTVELQRRFVRDRVFPGKAVSFLESLARRHGRKKKDPVQLDSLHVTYLVAEWSGLSLGILKSNVKMTKKLVLGALESRVIGQREACEAISNSILVTKAGLNNPQKPLACFLFIGPTGVGKTEAAKAAASYLYGSKERLLRFDMNEFPDAASVARLIGTGFRDDGDAADGLLTGRVRLKPFSVILFDEIEKAHHSIYDLLLQVLDEGHLTDAAGRSADFSNAIIILTSNLGVLRARGVADLPGGRNMTRGIYQEEVERFFRPEFVNRLDKIIPFDTLKSEDIQKITRLVVEDALGRDGLRRRRVVLNLDEHVIDKLVDLGTDEDLGARPLKRAVTQLIMEPLGRQLAATTPAQTTIAWVRSGKKVGVTVRLQIIENQKALQLPEGECLQDQLELSELIESGLKELRNLLRDSQGGEKVIDISDLRPKVRMRYRLLEELEDLETKFASVKVSSKDSAGRRYRGSNAGARQRKTTRENIRRHDAPALVHQPDDDLEDFFNHQNGRRAHPDKQLETLQELRRYGAALTNLVPTIRVETESTCLLGFWSLAPLKGQLYLELLADMYREIAHLFGHEAEVRAL